jgi:hypothetical protein
LIGRHANGRRRPSQAAGDRSRAAYGRPGCRREEWRRSWLTGGATHSVNPIKNYLIGLTPCVEAVSYKRRGKGRHATAYLLPNAPADIAGWLAERLGPIEWVRPAAPTAGEEAPPPAEPADVVDWLNGRFDEATERSPAPPPERPSAPPARPASSYRLRLRCQPPPARLECVACDPPHALPIERGGVTGKQQGWGEVAPFEAPSVSAARFILLRTRA